MLFSFFVQFQIVGRVLIDALVNFLSNFQQQVAYRFTFSNFVEYQLVGRVQIHFFEFVSSFKQKVAFSYRLTFKFHSYFRFCRRSNSRSRNGELLHFLPKFNQQVAYSINTLFHFHFQLHFCQISISRSILHIFIFCLISNSRSRIDSLFPFLSNIDQQVAYRCIFFDFLSSFKLQVAYSYRLTF